MPLYEYRCVAGHLSTDLRRVADRNDPLPCPQCGLYRELLISAPHIVPDGVYSYAPNIGSADAFEQRQEVIRKRKQDGGPAVVPKIL